MSANGHEPDTHDTIVSVAREVAERLNVVLAEHDRVEHDGEVCHDERINVLAYLLHRFGAPVNRVIEYQVMHEEHDVHDSHDSHDSHD
jgi:hypothetical protein